MRFSRGWRNISTIIFRISNLSAGKRRLFTPQILQPKMSMLKTFFLPLLLIVAPLAAQAESEVIPGATERTPSRSQYFSWINNRNEGATESQTLANLEFFKWLHDEYGMKLDIYAFDAGIIDGPKYYGSMDSRKFKSQFPRGLDPIYQLARSFDCRLGVWLGPDGYGDTPEQEAARREMLVKLCRDYHFALFKMDAVCTQLRPEKRDAFAKTMIECRKHSPDLILLNHRLDLGHATPHATTFLWGGEETYIDVHMTNKQRSGTHSRVEAMSRGLVPQLQRLTEDHGVCISSCLDYWEDDLILQAFNRNLILAPEIYGSPWFLRDDEFPKLARIYNLTRRYRDILVKGMVLDEARYGSLAVARGNDDTRLLTMRNLEWRPALRKIKLDASIGLAEGSDVEVRQFHPTERIIGAFKFGDEIEVEVLPFRACLLLVDRKNTGGVGVLGPDYQVVRDVPGKDVVIKLLGEPGSWTGVRVLGDFSEAMLDGKPAEPDMFKSQPNVITRGSLPKVKFDGKPLKQPWHRQLGKPAEVSIPADAEVLYEATCFASDNDSHEVRAMRRSGPTAIPVVQKARDEFLKQPVMPALGILQEQLIDGDSKTNLYLCHLGKRGDGLRHLRLDLGNSLPLEKIVFELAFNEVPAFEAELPVAEVSADLKSWQTMPMTRKGLEMVVDCDANQAIRYLRSKWIPERVAEIRLFGKGGAALDAKSLNLSWLFPRFREPKKVWSLGFTLDEAASGSYLAVACNGMHGVEGAWVAMRVDGKSVGAAFRAPSFPVNPFENGGGRTDRNHSYFIPVTPDMIGKKCEVVVLGLDCNALDFTPDVWITAYPIPHAERVLTLSR